VLFDAQPATSNESPEMAISRHDRAVPFFIFDPFSEMVVLVVNPCNHFLTARQAK
jgi:hypothetical protein